MENGIYNVMDKNGNVSKMAMEVKGDMMRPMHMVHPFGKPELGASWQPRGEWTAMAEIHKAKLIENGRADLQVVSA